MGVISAPQAARGGAGRHTRPTGPQPMGQEQEVHAVAHPSGAADRPVKPALHKPIRGIRALERPADPSPRTDAPMVADAGVARRTGRRDAGPSPLHPPGVRAQPWPRMAAAGARVMGVPPSALLKTRSRRRAGWHVGPQADEPVVRRGRGVDQSAPRFKAHPRGEAAHAPRLTVGQARHHRGLPTAR